MELILSLSAIALLGTVLAALLKPSAPAVAVAVSLVSIAADADAMPSRQSEIAL